MLSLVVFCVLLTIAASQITTSGITGNVAFDCQASNVQCAPGGTCADSGGACSCLDGLVGYNCALNSTLIVTTNCANTCQNGATCFAVTDGSIACYCPEGFHGSRCENRRVTSKCNPSSIELTIAPYFSGTRFAGFISVAGQDSDVACVFEPSTTAGVFTKTIGFSDCGGTNDRTLANGDIQKTFDVLVSHDDITTAFDTIFAFGCIIKAPGTTINRNLQEVVRPDTKPDTNVPARFPTSSAQIVETVGGFSSLPKKEVTEELFPFSVLLTDLEDNVVSGPQPLGTLLKLTYTLNGEDVYDRFRVEDVTVANGLADTRRASVDFVRDTCATADAVDRKKVVTSFEGDTTEQVSIVFRVFKLRFSNNLVFENTIKLCKGPGDDCNTTVCTEVPFVGLGRRKRAAEDEGILETMTTRIEVYIPGLDDVKTGQQSTGKPTMGECVQSVGFLILSITSLILFLLVVTVFIIFCVRMLHKSRKTSTTKSASVQSFDNLSFSS